MATKPTLDLWVSPKGLGTVIREEVQLVPKFSTFNIPGDDSDGHAAINWGGITRIIIVQCIHDGTGFDGSTSDQRIADFIFEIEEWVNTTFGQSSHVYTTSFNDAYNVNCFDFTWSKSLDDPNRIVYTLLLHQV